MWACGVRVCASVRARCVWACGVRVCACVGVLGACGRVGCVCGAYAVCVCVCVCVRVGVHVLVRSCLVMGFTLHRLIHPPLPPLPPLSPPNLKCVYAGWPVIITADPSLLCDFRSV